MADPSLAACERLSSSVVVAAGVVESAFFFSASSFFLRMAATAARASAVGTGGNPSPLANPGSWRWDGQI